MIRIFYCLIKSFFQEAYEFFFLTIPAIVINPSPSMSPEVFHRASGTCPTRILHSFCRRVMPYRTNISVLKTYINYYMSI